MPEDADQSPAPLCVSPKPRRVVTRRPLGGMNGEAMPDGEGEPGDGNYRLGAGWTCWSLGGGAGGWEFQEGQTPVKTMSGFKGSDPLETRWRLVAAAGSSEHQQAALGERQAAASSK